MGHRTGWWDVVTFVAYTGAMLLIVMEINSVVEVRAL